MNKTENKTNTHKEPLFNFKTTVSVQEVEGLNNRVYETLRTKIEDLKQKGYDTWDLETELLRLDTARREVSSSLKCITNLIGKVELEKEEEGEKNIVKFRAWHKKHRTMAKVVSLKLQGLKHIVWLEFLDEGLSHGKTMVCKLDDVILMHSTGFKDSNGKEVYEGDVVWVASSSENNYYYLIGTVEMFNDYWAVAGEDGAYVPLCLNNIDINVRGNKYEAPLNAEQTGRIKVKFHLDKSRHSKHNKSIVIYHIHSAFVNDLEL